uniref:Putative endonuclease/reverse transcript n=1 Tax=Ixodes ricinus TaxID=34613 RepID=A0A131Y5Y2_IXORI
MPSNSSPLVRAVLARVDCTAFVVQCSRRYPPRATRLAVFGRACGCVIKSPFQTIPESIERFNGTHAAEKNWVPAFCRQAFNARCTIGF